MSSVDIENATIARPYHFYITGFSGIPHMKYYYVFLFFVYFMSVLGNSFLMFVIYIDRNLHSPKYVVVFNLSFADICESTALIPKLLDTFLFENQFITYEACLSYMFFTLLFLTVQSLTITILCYDRLVAICSPLRYHMIVTQRSMLVIIGGAWALSLLLLFITVSFIARLSFCRSIVINSFYCDHGPLYRLACNDNSPSFIMSWLCPTVILWFPILFIVISYACICITLFKITTPQDRVKAMKTCSSHLILVVVFYFPICITYALGPLIHPNARIINLSLTSVLPPLLNPIIYTLKTEEFTQSVKKLLKRGLIFT